MLPKLFKREFEGHPVADYIIIGALTTFFTTKEVIKVSSTPEDPQHLCTFPEHSINQISLIIFLRNTKLRGVFHYLADILAIRTKLRRLIKKIVDFCRFKDVNTEEDESPIHYQIVTHPITGMIVRQKTGADLTVSKTGDKFDIR